MSSVACQPVSLRYYRDSSFAALIAAAWVLAPWQSAQSQAPRDIPSWHDEAQPSSNRSVTRVHLARHDTIEQRIASLHALLKITRDEESLWASVAQTMRDNEAAMLKLGADERAASPAAMTATGDLRAYQKFAQAHVDGLTKMIASFESLYAAMPDAQKKLADDVFASFGHDARHASK